jgi:nitroreductase
MGEFMFGVPAAEVMQKRVSVRTYTDRPVPAEARERIRAYMETLTGPFAVKPRFALLDREEEDARLGTYGVIRGARLYAAAAVKSDAERAMEQLGYAFEKLICFATALGLGTCWLAGSLNRSAFSRAMRLEPDEILPVVSPIGYPKKSRSVVEVVMKPSGRENRVRRDWAELFFDDGFARPLDKAESGALASVLEMVRIAPSASNRQPWRLVKTEGAVHFYLRRARGYKNVMGFDMQKIDMGIAMFHFECCAREAGLDGRWETAEPGLAVPEGTEYIVTWSGGVG